TILGVQEGPLPDVPLRRVEEVGIALVQPVAARMNREPQRNAQPGRLQAEGEHGGQAAIEDGDDPGQARDRHRLRQRAMEADLEPLEARDGHQNTAPEVAVNKVVMNVVAVRAMARPQTMPIPLRTTEPLSDTAKPRPVMTMAMMPTALATGPDSDASMVCSGVSQGMDPPVVVPAQAGAATVSATKAASGADRIRAAAERREGGRRFIVGLAVGARETRADPENCQGHSLVKQYFICFTALRCFYRSRLRAT